MAPAFAGIPAQLGAGTVGTTVIHNTIHILLAFTLPPLLWAMGWLSTGAMAVAVAAMFVTW